MYGSAGNAPGGFKNFQHCGAGFAPKVDGEAPVVFAYIIHSQSVRGSKIAYMYIVPDAGAIPRVVIVPEDRKLLPHSHGNFHDHRDKVRRVLFQPRDSSFHIVARGVKVAEAGKAYAL